MVVDRRPYVVSKAKSESFVGLMRGGFGNPSDIVTTSGNALSSDVEEAVVHGLRNSGVMASAANTAERDSRKALAGNSRMLVIIILEWKTDTMRETDAAFDLSAEIYDATGQLLGSSHYQDKGSAASGTEAARKALTDLLAAPEIVSSL
jgi:hypothetical protein